MASLSKDEIDKIVTTHGAGMRKALEDAGRDYPARPRTVPPSTPTAGECRETRTKASVRRLATPMPTEAGSSDSLVVALRPLRHHKSARQGW